MHMIRLTQLEVIIYRLSQLSTEGELLMRGHSVIQSEFSNYNNLSEREIYPPHTHLMDKKLKYLKIHYCLQKYCKSHLPFQDYPV